MNKKMWAGAAIGVIAVVVLMAILVATATPKDPQAAALLYLERGYQTPFRAVKMERDSKFHEGFPDQYQVRCVAVDDAGQDVGEDFGVTVNYDKGLRVSDGGQCWSSPYCLSEAAALHKAASTGLDRPLSQVHFTPRAQFNSVDELQAWGPFADDPERAFELSLVVFDSADQAGPAVVKLLAEWMPRWATARKVRVLVGFCGDRRDKVTKPYEGVGYGWKENTDTLWTIELLGATIGTADAAAIQAATEVRHPSAEADK